jgi:hypothetical protein
MWQPFFDGFILLFCLLVLLSVPVSAQTHTHHPCFREITLQIDTNSFAWSKDEIVFKNEKYLPFLYQKEDAIAEVRLYINANDKIKNITLMPSADFDIIDSIFKSADYYRFKVRFSHLTQSKFLSFNLVSEDKSGEEIPCEVKLMPYHKTVVEFYPKDEELYIGEEKAFELITNNIENIQTENIFTKNKDINYRTEIVENRLRLYLLPSKLGEYNLELELGTINPFLDDKKVLRYLLPVIKQKFKVKGSRLAFLNTDIKDITLEDKTQKQGEIAQLDFSRILSLQKTYRIEAQETAGGALVAELFTKSYLSNGKILCIIRPYSFHRLTDGYLYLKNGDEPICITNFTITPKTTITSLTVLHQGGIRNNSILPGETVEVRIEGLALNKADFKFEALNVVSSDSVIRTESVQTFKLQAPINITEKEIDLYNRGEKTGRTIFLTEHQKAHNLNFVNINFGQGRTPVTELPQTILYPHTINDIELSFASEKIDESNILFGKQYIDVDITVSGPKGELIEIKKLDNVLICPAENSPRFAFYADKLCSKAPVSLNTLLGRKTYDLDGWSKIEIVISHDKERQGGDGFTKKIELILKRKFRFDTDVSFPGGLIIKRGDQKDFSPFGGISLAIIHQMSFYHPEKINRYRPYKIGLGVLANNAFNFSENATNRDVGVVLLGSLYPTRRDVKLSFPLFAGVGRFLSANAWFFLLGPGIYINI